MNKLVLIAILAVVAIGAFLLLRQGDHRQIRDEDADEAGMASGGRAPSTLNPLETGGATVARARPQGMATEGGDEVPSAAEGDDQFTSSVEVLAIDDETGQPIEKASVFLGWSSAGLPCPGNIDMFLRVADGGPRPDIHTSRRTSTFGSAMQASGLTDPQGRYKAKWTDDPADIVVRKKGWILAVQCKARPGGTTTIRMQRGLSIEGLVVDMNDKPVVGAKVDAMPPRGIAAAPGRRERATTGADGAFAVEGLVAGSYDLIVTHSKYMPETRPGVPTGKRGLRIPMRPAFRVTFKITTDNQMAPESPTVGWSVPGAPPWEGIEMLRSPDIVIAPAENLESTSDINLDVDMAPPDPNAPIAASLPAGTFIYKPVPIPAGRPTATFTVKAVGMETWTSSPINVPAEGGAITIDVPLRRDPDLGSAKIALEDQDHRPLSFVTERCRLSIGRRDGKAVDAGVVYQPGEVLHLPALPSGPYRFQIRSPKHAPATVDLDVPPGREAEGKVTLGPPAKLHIRATAPEATTVKLQLRQGREIVWPFIESTNVAPAPSATPPGGPSDSDQDEGGNEQSVPSGGDGLLLTGLPAGRVTVEILSPEWTAPPAGADLVEGETKELEIAVTKK